jgi:excisionase family DNA binding protein
MKDEFVGRLAGTLMVPADVAEILHVTRQHVVHLVSSGKLDGVQKGRFWLISASSVQQFIDDKRRAELDIRAKEDAARLDQDRRRLAEDIRTAN